MALYLFDSISRRISAAVSNWMSTEESVHSPSKISPWLMLPSAFEGGDMVYKFYSIADDKVLRLNRTSAAVDGGEKTLDLAPDDDAKLVGSSHGWLALFNERNCDLFLSNPLSRRHVKLPPIHTLTIPEENLSDGTGCVTQIIISCSPELDEDCRAMMTYGPEDRLAFCWPGRSTEWTPIGELYHKREDDRIARAYQSFVYSSKQKLFFCVTQFGDLEAWDLKDPGSPRLIRIEESVDHEDKYPIAARSEEELQLIKLCQTLKFLVVDDKSGDLFLVRRFYLEQVDSNGSYVEEIYYDSDTGFDVSYPYKTIGFDVHRYDQENRVLRYMDGGSLGGLAFFIGLNHGFALSTVDFPELKPDSIYYTDVLSPPEWVDRTYGGHDLGIFSYKDGTISRCYYPCDVKSIKRIIPAPTWFAPTSPALLIESS